MVCNTYQYGNQILLSPIPTSLPSGYALPTGYTSSTIFENNGFPSVSRTPYITLPQLSNSTSTLGNFLGFGSYSASVNVPASTDSGALISPIYTATPLNTSTTITNGGTRYISNSIITFTGGTFTTPASGTITATAGVITAVSITTAGSYTVPPTGYSISVPGINAVIGSSLLGTSVSTTVVVNNGGTGYQNLSAFYFTGGTYTTQASGFIKTTVGVITSISITTAGAGHTSPPTGFTISVGGGSGLSLTYSLNSTTVSSTFTFTNGGTGYLTGSIKTFTGGIYTTQAYGTITATSGPITAITLTSAGSGYKSQPA